ncbi:hypothetical protein [Candidatus Odyssella thessalonicensis]|uniref:hypothetical protein n=1 Tax=Candidatus Odyssella thessalonicensis TaxID=84647 RepID=UPI000225B776|nr:hypothetical protein [Candidatus Odyssella thessalonicensis]
MHDLSGLGEEIINNVVSTLVLEKIRSWLKDDPKPLKRMPIKDFMDGVSKKGWDPENLDLLSFMAKLRQSALDGEVTLWGKPYKQTNLLGCNQYEPLIQIPQEEWEHLPLDALHLYYVKDNTETLIPSKDYLGEKYQDIYIDGKALKWLKKGKH